MTTAIILLFAAWVLFICTYLRPWLGVVVSLLLSAVFGLVALVSEDWMFLQVVAAVFVIGYLTCAGREWANV